MHPSSQVSVFRLSLALALLITAGSVVAAPVISGESSSTQFTYQGDVSSSDLLNGLTPATTGWNMGNEASPLELTDGIHGDAFNVVAGDRVQGAWTTVGATAEYNLGTGANGTGYDITSAVSIADWVNVGFGNQVWTLEAKPVGGSYSTIATVDYQDLGNGAGTTKVTLTDSTGVLATGIGMIKVTANSQSGHTSGAFVWRELDIFGTDSAPNDSPPLVSALSPADDGTNIATEADLVITFDEAVVAAPGSLTVHLSSDDSVVETIDLSSGNVVIAGAEVTVDISDLSGGVSYYVNISAGALKDLTGNDFAGILDAAAWNFTTTTLVVTEMSSATQFDFAADVSDSDLLNGLNPVTTGWNTTNEASPLELTDGIHGDGFNVVAGDRVQGAWTTVGASAEYELGLSANGQGYDLTSIQSIADWVSVGFGNQGWTIEVMPLGSPYVVLATVNSQPLGTGGGSTKVTLTDVSGVLATGIEMIRITANSVNGGANSGAFVWRELDVFGVPSGPDETSPTVASLSPADDASDVPPGSNLVMTFDENILTGSGSIRIKNLDAPSEIVIPAADSQVSESGKTLTINPTTDLDAGTNYAVQIDATAIEDWSGNGYAGIADDTTWSFSTGTPDVTAPVIATLNPADGANNVAIGGNLVATFDEVIAVGSGNITIKNLETLSENVIPVGNAQVSVSGAELTINPSALLEAGRNYAVQIDAAAITDLFGNAFAGISDDESWNFTTAVSPLRIMCLGDSITVGYTDNPSWTNHPFMFGYRSGLYTRLTSAGYNFQFVGASTEPWTGISGDPTNGGTYTPALDLRDFGQDMHRGYGGAGIWNNVDAWIAADNPDVILLLIGINGISSSSPAALNTLVNSIVTTAPDVHLIVAQITPRVSFNQNLFDYNVYIRDTLVPAYAGNGHKVTTVDLYSPFLTNPNDYTSAITPGVLSNNINHPDNPRYDLMAQEWFEGIEALGLNGESFDNWISGFNVGALTGFNDDPDGDGIVNGLENFLGTNPSISSAGLALEMTAGGSVTFSHTQNESPANDVSAAAYEWSTDLENFHTGGVSAAGTTVTFSASANDPVTGTTTVTATVSGTPLATLFVRFGVSQN